MDIQVWKVCLRGPQAIIIRSIPRTHITIVVIMILRTTTITSIGISRMTNLIIITIIIIIIITAVVAAAIIHLDYLDQGRLVIWDRLV